MTRQIEIITEGLPEEDGVYMVYVKDGEGVGPFNVLIVDGDLRYRESFEKLGYEVVGWYRMPDPPVGKWRFAQVETYASPGIHDMEVRLMDSSQSAYRTETFKLRVEPRVTTELSFGVFEGSAGFTVNLDRKEGIAE